MRTLKTGISILLASAISVSAVPLALANGLERCLDRAGKGALAGSTAGAFVGGNKGKYGGLIGGGAACGLGALGDAFSSFKGQNSKGHKNLGYVGDKRNAELNRNTGKTNGGKTNPAGKAKPAPQQPAIVAAPAKPKPVADPSILAAQEHLLALGYTQVGKPDGFAGKGTAAAVMAFQKDQMIEQTGKLDDGMMAFISREAANRVAEPVSEVASTVVDPHIEKEVSTAPVNEPVGTPTADVAINEQDNEMTNEEYAEAERDAGPVTDEMVSEPARAEPSAPVETSIASASTPAPVKVEKTPSVFSETKQADANANFDETF